MQPDLVSIVARRTIIVNGRQHDNLVAEAVDVLDEHNDPPILFRRAGHLVRVRTDEADRPLVEEMRLDHMRLHLATAATWQRELKEGGYTHVDPPPNVAASVLASGHWPYPALAGITEAPIVRRDGTVHVDHGYDPATRLYHWHRGEPYLPVPDEPTRTELCAAVALVTEVLCDFPFDTSADRANAWALLLTPLIRSIIDGQVPLALLDAPEPGTGKGLLAKVVALVTTGRTASMMAWPPHDEELGKLLTAELSGGSTMVIFDNVEGIIKSAVLAGALTADVWKGRILGRSENVLMPNRATWMATGNNIDVGGDLARRCYRIRLDARQARPWMRTEFRHDDLEAWVTAHRREILQALLTIVRAWWVAGKPAGPTVSAMGGYTPWTRTVGGILAHAGINDYLSNLVAFHADADRESQSWEAFLAQWSASVGEQAITVGEVINKMGDVYTGHLWREVLPDDLAGYWEKPTFAKRLGNALRQRCGRHYGEDGLHLVDMPKDRRRVCVYTVTTRAVSLELVEPGSAGYRAEPARADLTTSTDADIRGFAGSTPTLRAGENPIMDPKTQGPGEADRTREPARGDFEEPDW